MSERIRLLVVNRTQIEHMLSDALRRDYPVGEQIEWRIGAAQTYTGRVTMNCYDDRIKVRNDRTGKERFITADAIVS